VGQWPANRLTKLVNRLTEWGSPGQARRMVLGLGTYAFFWQWHATAERPLTLLEMLDATAAAGVSRFQICDYPAIETCDEQQLATLRQHADRLSMTLELGTRGTDPNHLQRYLDLADRLGVTLVRSMLAAVGSGPDRDEAVRRLKRTAAAYEAAGVALALETYEQVPVSVLVDVVEAVGSPALGICLDPANCVAALEHPLETIRRTAPYVRNVHVKDFRFTRQDGWVGFSLVGCPLGEGLLPYADLVEIVEPEARGLSQIVEHWLPWQGDSASTIELERRWTAHNLSYLDALSSPRSAEP
jgi:sugar phosphate isomerase/epimerase